MKNQKGFSLIELLIVVVIIGIIAAIAIPNLLAARRSANEGSAVSSLRTLHGAQMTFQGTVGSGSFAAALTDLQGQGLVDGVLASGAKSGYTFTGSAVAPTTTTPATFIFSCIPQATGAVTGTGTRKFGIATPGVIVFDAGTLTAQFAASTTVATGLATGSPLNN